MIPPRPRYLNLLKIHLPITGLISILHRISGILLFFFIPLIIWVLQFSLSSSENFQKIQESIYSPLGGIILTLFLFILMQHLFAGLRFLLMDLDFCMDKQASRKTAVLGLLMSVLATVMIIMGIYL